MACGSYKTNSATHKVDIEKKISISDIFHGVQEIKMSES